MARLLTAAETRCRARQLRVSPERAMTGCARPDVVAGAVEVLARVRIVLPHEYARTAKVRL